MIADTLFSVHHFLVTSGPNEIPTPCNRSSAQAVRIPVRESVEDGKKKIDVTSRGEPRDIPALDWERNPRTRRLGPRPGVSWGSVHSS